MNKLAQLIQQMSEDEVKNLQRDLRAGHLQALINERLDELQETHECPVCSKPVTDDDYRLEFGEGVRMEARFDALDCLQHFVEKLRGSESEQR